MYGYIIYIHLPAAYPPPCLPTGPKDLKNLSQTAQKWSLGGSGDHLGTKMLPKSAQNCPKLDPGGPLGTTWDPLGLPMVHPWGPRSKKDKKLWFVGGQMWLKHSK